MVTTLAEVKRKKGESFESLLRRFSRRMQESGRMLQAKKIRFHNKPKGKLAMRTSALHKQAIRTKNQYLLRSGKATEEELQPKRGRRRR